MFSGMKLAIGAVVAAVALAAWANEPESFVERVERSQGIAPAADARGGEGAGSYAEPGSFVARVQLSQGLAAAHAAAIVGAGDARGEPESFVARVKLAQHLGR